MSSNKLILRSIKSPWVTPTPDVTKGSVLTHEELDNNFIYLRGELIYDITSPSAGFITFKKINGQNLSFSGGLGDMFAFIYDPTNVNGDAFSMDNMVEGATTKIFTDLERAKLSALVSSHYMGKYTSFSGLTIAHPTANPGDYADVDMGLGNDIERYIWDDDDNVWILQLGESTALTDAQIKVQYENNPNTNAFTDAEKTKLSGLTNNTDDFLTSATFNTGNGILSLGMQSGSTVTVDLDNRYSLTGHGHTLSDITDYILIDDFVTGATFNTTNGILEFTRQSGSTFNVDLDGRYLTIDSDSQILSFTASTGDLEISNGNIINLDGRYALTGDTSTNTDDYVTGATFNTGDGILTLTRQSGSTLTVDLDGRYLTSETDSQTLTFSADTGNLEISSGNIVNLDGRYSLTGHTHSTVNFDAHTGDTSIHYQQSAITAVLANTAHATSVGTDHGYIDQDVTTTAKPTYRGLTIKDINSVSGSTLTITNDFGDSPKSIIFSNTTGDTAKITGFGRYDTVGGAYTSFEVTDVSNLVEVMRLYSNELRVSGDTWAHSFVKSGGTSSQFLKADGSVDENTYITSESDNQTLTFTAATGNLEISNGNIINLDGRYQPITGMTGYVDATGSTATGQVPYFADTDTITGTNDFFWDSANTRLGIGTNTPSHALHIKDISSDGLGRTRFMVESTTATAAALFSMVNSDGNLVSVQATGPSYITGPAGNFGTAAPGGTGIFDLRFGTDGHITTGGSSKIQFRAGGYNTDDIMTIYPSRVVSIDGNLGIGTISPSYPLEVHGNTTAYSFITSGGTASQFVKGDGTLDSTVYLTSGDTTTNTDDFVTGATFNTGDGILTFIRQSGDTFNVDLDGRYLTSETDSQTLTFTASTGNLEISSGNIVSLDGRYSLTGHTHQIYDDHIADTSIHYQQSAITITSTQVSDFFSAVTGNTVVVANTAHATSVGTDHGYIDQDVTTTAKPTFRGLTVKDGNSPSGSTLTITNDLGESPKSLLFSNATGDTAKITGFGRASTPGGAYTSFEVTDNTSLVEVLRLYASGATFNVPITTSGGTSDDWNSAYNDTITGMTVTGSSTKTITLEQRDGGTITANFTDNTGGGGGGDVVTGMTFNTSNGILTLSTLSGDTVTEDLDGRYLTISAYTDNDTNIFVTGSTFNTTNGILEFTNVSGGTFNVDIDGRYSLTGHTHSGFITGATAPDTSVQFNNGGAFSGTSNFTWDGDVNISSTLSTSSGQFINVEELGFSKSAKVGVHRSLGNPFPGIWFNQSSPDITNYAFLAGATDQTIFNTPSGTDMGYRIGNAQKMIIWSTGGVSIGDAVADQTTGTDPGSDNLLVGGSITATTINISESKLDYQENLTVDSATTETIATVSVLTHKAVFFDYVVSKGTNIRAGTIMSTFMGVTTAFTDNSTTDIGDTSGVTFSTDISGSNLRLLADTTTNGWEIKVMIRAL